VKALGDRTIPPATSDRAAAIARNAYVIAIPDLGHLAHEENPVLAAKIIADPAAFKP
jgi:magnesium chelatase accessory protein